MHTSAFQRRRQGDRGLSLQEQRAFIIDYAAREHLQISAWFEEQQTAAVIGRPVFLQMIELIKAITETGVIMLKVDRGSRNLREWADIGDLIDAGVDVRIAGESVDLRTRGGRLSADIQAVIAADYIRALREEVRRGFNGRIKQGLFPLPAPIGYEDRGGGKTKTIHPIDGHLVHSLFSFYATGAHTLRAACGYAEDIGLHNKNDRVLSMNSVARLLRNPFYVGRIQIRGRDLCCGQHEPLISEPLFDRVQQLLVGKRRGGSTRRSFLFSRLVRCGCGRNLCGEIQKRHVYYRCHTKECQELRCIREEWIERAIIDAISRML